MPKGSPRADKEHDILHVGFSCQPSYPPSSTSQYQACHFPMQSEKGFYHNGLYGLGHNLKMTEKGSESESDAIECESDAIEMTRVVRVSGSNNF